VVDLKAQKTTTTETKTASSSRSKLWMGIVAPTGLLGILFVFLAVKRRKKKETEKIEIPVADELPKGPIFLNESKESAPAETIDYWSDAEKHVEDAGVFAILFPKAIIQRIEQCEKCNFQSREKAFDRLVDTNPEIATGLRELIELCDQYRYGFGAEHLETKEILARAKELLGRLPS